MLAPGVTPGSSLEIVVPALSTYSPGASRGTLSESTAVVVRVSCSCDPPGPVTAPHCPGRGARASAPATFASSAWL